MAEIKELPIPAEQKSEISESNFDPETMRTTKPGLKRLFLTLSVLLCFILGLPFLWKSVEIYRSTLPFGDMDNLSKGIESNPLQFPCHFQAIFANSNSNVSPQILQSSILAQMSKISPQTSQCGTCSRNFTLSVTVESFPDRDCRQSLHVDPSYLYKCGTFPAVDFDFGDVGGVDEALKSVLGDSCSGFGGNVYSIVVVNQDDVEAVRAVVGKYRHAWLVGKDLEAEVMVERLAEIFVKVFANGGRDKESIHGEFMPVGADGRIVLSFNLLNANPEDWFYDWDFQRIDEVLLAPLIEALAPIANISVESQVLYHSPKSSFSSWDEKLGKYIFKAKDLPFFVNSNEWHLDTSVAAGGRSKILQFVIHTFCKGMSSSLTAS